MSSIKIQNALEELLLNIGLRPRHPEDFAKLQNASALEKDLIGQTATAVLGLGEVDLAEKLAAIAPPKPITNQRLAQRVSPFQTQFTWLDLTSQNPAPQPHQIDHLGATGRAVGFV